jgi:hypothetical protein
MRQKQNYDLRIAQCFGRVFLALGLHGVEARPPAGGWGQYRAYVCAHSAVDQRSLREGHPDRKPLVLQAWGLGRRLTTFSWKKTQVTETTDINGQGNLDGAGITDTGSMTTMGQSLREAQRPTRSLVTPKDIHPQEYSGASQRMERYLVRSLCRLRKSVRFHTQRQPMDHHAPVWNPPETDPDGQGPLCGLSVLSNR